MAYLSFDDRHPAIVLLFLLLICGLDSGSPALAQSGRGSAQAVSPRAVWRPREGLWESISNECRTDECFSKRMHAGGASPAAVAFSRRLKFQEYLRTFVECGRVDFGIVTSPLMNDPLLDRAVLLNGNLPIIDVYDTIRNVDISTARGYLQAVRRYKATELWPGINFKSSMPADGGGQIIVVSALLLNGCRGCEVVGELEVRIYLNSSGSILRVQAVEIRLASS